MSKMLRLAVASPVAMQGTERGIWIADADSHSLVCLTAAEGKQVAEISLEGAPVSMATAGGMVAAGLASGTVVAFDGESGAELWRRPGPAGARLKGEGNYIWAGAGDSLAWFDRSGAGGRTAASGMRAFAPGADGVFWLSRDGVLSAYSVAGSGTRTLALPAASGGGAMAACANAIWVSVNNGLLLVEQYAMELRTTLAAPEGPVPHLICADGKLIGGLIGVFVLNPMTDARVHPLAVKPESPLRAIAANSSMVWALESARPVVHITELY
jgi:outer membrane protein assembly factor BamB